MANYPIAQGQISAQDKQLTASTVDTVTFTDDVHAVEIATDGTTAVYVTIDGSTPTVSGSNTYKMPTFPSTLVLTPASPAAVVVKLISAGTPFYSVTKAY